MEHNPEEAEDCIPPPPKRQKASSSLATPEITPDYDASDRAYDVFLNFRGPDSRYTVADVLYHSLTKAGFRVFLDDEEIRKGEVIEGELLAAITNSSIYISIFSKDYASSKWCLRELAKMIVCCEAPSSSDTKKVILPIFYDVDVSEDVKLRSLIYSTALQKHKHELGEDIVKQWEDALMKVATIKGWNLKDHGLTELADLISKEVFSKLTASEAVTSLPDHLVGIDKPVEDIIQLLEEGSPGVRFIVIHGMGGIGKTTLADAVFRKISSHYQGGCFLKDVRRSTSVDDMVKLQEKLLTETLNVKSIKVFDIHDGIHIISKRLRYKKVLIVLDDVEKRDHLLKLAANSSWFGPKSRIIITTRNTEFLPTEVVNEYYPYEMKKMDSRHALQLFCRHAFEKDKPPHDFYGISTEIVDTTGELPLSLQVIGSSLYNQDDGIWKFRLMKLKEAPHKDVQETLMISYQALDLEQQKIFLDIACLFNDAEKTYPIYFWQACELCPDCSIGILVKRSLIKVSNDGKLWMHDQLRDFGRAIAQSKYLCLESQISTKPSCLWSSKCALDALKNQEVAQSVVAIKLGAPYANYRFVPDEFARANSLKFLTLEGGNFEGDFENILQQLRWLSWSGCPLRLEGTNLCFKNLVILKISSSNIDEDWGGWCAFMESTHLKVLHLEDCKCLKKTPKFSALMQLEILILRDCSNLEEIDSSVSKLKHLKRLEISNKVDGDFSYRPPQPRLIQGSIGDLKSIELLKIFDVGLTKLDPSIGKLTLLKELDLSHSAIENLPDSIGELKRLEILRMVACPIKCLPDTIGKLESLKELNLSFSEISLLPEAIGNLKRLKVIIVGYTCIEVLPKTLVQLENLERLQAYTRGTINCNLPEDIGKLSVLRILEFVAVSRVPATINQLSHLQELYLHGIQEFQALLKLPTSLISLKVECSSLEWHRVPDLSIMTNLVTLSLCNSPRNYNSSPCNQTPQMKWLARMTKLENLEMVFPNLISPPTELSSLSRLQSLRINCFDVQSLPHLPSSLDDLDLIYVKSPINWQRLSSLSNLSTLKLISCLLEVIKVDCFEHLHVLELSDCDFLVRLSGLSCLKELRELTMHSCRLLVDVEGLEELKSLQRLELAGCGCIEVLPDLSSLKKLKELNLFSCESLESIPEVDGEVPCHLNIADCDHFYDFDGPYSERHRAIKHECSWEGTGSHFEGSSESKDDESISDASSEESWP